MTRTVKDMLTILNVLTVPDTTTEGDFWRQQTYVKVPEVTRPDDYLNLLRDADDALRGKRIAVPKMFIGVDDPKAKPVAISEDVITLYQRARKDLEDMGATVIETDFPLVSNYEDETVTGQPNNVVGFKPDWNRSVFESTHTLTMQ